MRTSIRTLWCIALFLCLPSLGMAQTLQPDAILPFNESGWSPGFVPAGPEQLPEGPAAIAATRHAVFIADNVRGQVLVLDRNGSPIGAVPLSTPVADLRVDPTGHMALLSAAHERLLTIASDGTPISDIPLPPSTVRGLATSPEGGAWTVHVSGEGTPPGALPGGQHAAPLGRHGSLHGAGVLRDSRTGDVLLWDWDRPADLKGLGPSRTLRVKTTRRLGLIRPIHMDRHGAIYLLLETLSDHAPLEVTLEIRRIQPNGRASRVAWDVHPHAPSSASVAIDDDGTVYRYESRPEGMLFWRVDAQEWMEVQR